MMNLTSRVGAKATLLLVTATLLQWLLSVTASTVKADMIVNHKQRQLEVMDPIQITESGVQSLFFLYNEALLSGDPIVVASEYSSKAVVIPSENDTPKTSHEEIVDYYTSFLLTKPSLKVLSRDIMIGEGWAQDAGIYEVVHGIDGRHMQARYSFIYVLEDGLWRIEHHHASSLPSKISRGPEVSEIEVRALFGRWNEALATGDSEVVTSRYATDAVLLPTVSDLPRSNHELIKEYFDSFLLKKPQGVILESYVSIGTNIAEDVGIYEFTFGSDNSTVKARYTFVYTYDADQDDWLIQHHQSSLLPEMYASDVPPAQPIDDDGVRALFSVWNDALATLDSAKVTARYAKGAVLLPTVSDTPRDTPELIQEYFDDFLLKKPQGVIESGRIMIGHNWAQDTGIYIFTMAADGGSQVQARYTYVYVFEDGEWKISQHHSSVMPEAFL